MMRLLLNTELKILLLCNSPGNAFFHETKKNGIYFIGTKSRLGLTGFKRVSMVSPWE